MKLRVVMPLHYEFIDPSEYDNDKEIEAKGRCNFVANEEDIELEYLVIQEGLAWGCWESTVLPV